MQPNIVIITTHDSGRHFGCYGAKFATPAIDALAADGVICTRMFAPAPICSPSRATLMSGQCPQRNGMMGLAGGPWAWEMKDHSHHLSHVARTNGYQTHLFGHQHDSDYVENLGFDQLHQYLSPHDRQPGNGAPVIAGKFADFCATKAKDRPFYAQIGFFETHTPFDFGGATADDPAGVTVPEWCHKDDEATRQQVAALQGAARQADRAVGIILDALRDNGLERDTIVLFNTDHGPELPRGKWTMFDGGLGIAFIVRWPGGGITGGRRCELLLGNEDWLPTLAELSGLEVKHTLDGRSFAAALRGGSDAAVRDAVYGLWVDMDYSIRTERHKLIRRFRGERVASKAVHPDGRSVLEPAAKLFDLQADPLELNNLADDPASAQTLAEMNRRLWDHLESVDDPILRGPVPSPFYVKAMADFRSGAGR